MANYQNPIRSTTMQSIIENVPQGEATQVCRLPFDCVRFQKQERDQRCMAASRMWYN